MDVKKIKVSFRDRRGEISDILENVPISHITIISSRKDSVRGNHYHQKSVQYTYVIKGRLKIFTQMPGKKIETAIVKAGNLVLTPPKESHAIVSLEDSEYMVFTKGPRGGKNYEKDTYRLAEKLTEVRRRY